MENNQEFKKFLNKLMQQNTATIINSLVQTKYQKEIAGEDDDKREKQLDEINDTLERIEEKLEPKKETTPEQLISAQTNLKNTSDTEGKPQFEPKTELQEIDFKEFAKTLVASLKKDVSGVTGLGKSITNTVKNFAISPKETITSLKENTLQKISSTKNSVKEILTVDKDYWPMKEVVDKKSKKIKETNNNNKSSVENYTDKETNNTQTIVSEQNNFSDKNSEKQSSDKNSEVSKTASEKQSLNPEADNIVTNDEIIADNSKQQTSLLQNIFSELQLSTKEIIKLSESIQSKSLEKVETKESNKVSENNSESSDILPNSIDIDIDKRNKSGGGRSLKGKPGLGKALSGIGSKALSAVKFLGPAAALAGAAYGGFTGYQNTAENFDLKEGEEATTGQKISSSLGGVASSLSFGLIDEKSAAQGIQGAGEKIGEYGSKAIGAVGGFFGGIGNKISDTVGYAKKQAGLDLSGGVGKELSEALVGTKETLKTSEVTDSAGQTVASKDYRSGITSEKSIFGSKLLGSLFSSKGQEIGSFLGSSEESKNFSAVGDEATSFNKSGSIMGRRISSGSLLKADTYKVTGDSDEEMDVSKSDYFKIQELAKEGKTEEAKKIIADIKMRREVNEEVAAGIKSPEESLTPITPKKETSVAPIPSKTSAVDVKSGSAENVALRDEISSKGTTPAPVVMSSVNSNSTNNYVPMKADPYPKNRGSALDNYVNRITTF